MSERVKYTIEFPLRAKPELIYNYVSTPSGLSEWFADDVNINGQNFLFYWNGDEERAEVARKKPNKLIRYEWLDREDEYLTFEIEVDDLTGDTSLIITYFDDEEELEEAKLMWEAAIDQLKGTIGG